MRTKLAVAVAGLCLFLAGTAVSLSAHHAFAAEFDATKPDGTPRKLMEVSRLTRLGWKASTELKDGLRTAYGDFLARTTAGA